MQVHAWMHFSSFHRIWYVTSGSLQRRKTTVDRPNGPSHTKLRSQRWNDPLARSSPKLTEPKKSLYFIIHQKRNKNAVNSDFQWGKMDTVISSGAKSPARRISSHLKTLMGIRNLRKSYLKVQAKKTKVKKADRKYIMREFKWSCEMLLKKN